jgi:hypothetical protein
MGLASYSPLEERLMQSTTTQRLEPTVEPETAFESRLGAAVRAGAWLLLVDVGLILVQWLTYLTIMRGRPAWFLALMGSDVEWPLVQSLWLHGILLFKLVFWVHLLVVVSGAVWVSMLRQAGARGAIARDTSSESPAREDVERTGIPTPG